MTFDYVYCKKHFEELANNKKLFGGNNLEIIKDISENSIELEDVPDCKCKNNHITSLCNNKPYALVKTKDLLQRRKTDLTKYDIVAVLEIK